MISLATEIEGYWNSVLDFILIDPDPVQRALRRGRYTRRLGFPIVGKWQERRVVPPRGDMGPQSGHPGNENGVEKASSWGSHALVLEPGAQRLEPQRRLLQLARHLLR